MGETNAGTFQFMNWNGDMMGIMNNDNYLDGQLLDDTKAIREIFNFNIVITELP